MTSTFMKRAGVFRTVAGLAAVLPVVALEACTSEGGGLWGPSSSASNDDLPDATTAQDATALRDAPSRETAAPALPPPGGFDTNADGGGVFSGVAEFANELDACRRTFRCVSLAPRFEVVRSVACVRGGACKSKTEDGTETMFPESGYCSTISDAGPYASTLSDCTWP